MTNSHRRARRQRPAPGRADGHEDTTKADAARQAASPASGSDPLKVLMPAGEAGGRNPPITRPATANGGTSGAEDTTRTAGYVTDLASSPATPPGPPIAKDAALLVGPDKVPAPPPPLAPSVPAPVRAAVARGAEAKPPTQDEIAVARMQGESPATGTAPPPSRPRAHDGPPPRAAAPSGAKHGRGRATRDPRRRDASAGR